ncbi:glycosyltransferase [Egbenema bharatensis]|uniref:glycosyltransferase n=1 Tax=Egbenema bharatensis TaxID=3463334 RepID=UPI003A8565B6
MPSLLSFRPGVIGNNTAFEAMAAIYKYLQDHYGYNFTLVFSETDTYHDPAFKTIPIPKQDWRSLFSSPYLPPRDQLPNTLKTEFAKADGILTVDPTIFGQARMAIAAAHRLQKPVWFDTSRTIQNDYSTMVWSYKRRLWLQSALQQTTGIIATVPKCLERFQELGLLSSSIADKFTIMGHPVDTDVFQPRSKLSEMDGILRILVVSRLIPEKGLFYILEALTPLLSQRSDVQLHLIGDGVLRHLLEREVTERQLTDRVIFLDTLPHEKLSSTIAQYDLFVNHAIGIATWEEFFGVANLEAMACELPCVVTSNGGISYAIREDVASFVPERNILQLRNAVTQLLDSESLRKTMGQKARQYVEAHYSIRVIAERYHQMLNSPSSKPSMNAITQ